MADRRSDVDAWFDQQEEQQRPQLPVADVFADLRSPDDVANERRIAEELGQPPQAVRAYPDLFARSAEAARTNRATEQSPRLRAWLSQPENFAVARDDVGPFVEMERMGENEAALERWDSEAQGYFNASPYLRPFRGLIAIPRGLARPVAQWRDNMGTVAETGAYYSGESQNVLGGVEQNEMSALQRRQQQAFEGLGEPLNDEEAMRLMHLEGLAQPEGGVPVVREALRQWPLLQGTFERAAGEVTGDVDPAGAIYWTPAGRRALARGRADWTDFQSGNLGDFGADLRSDVARDVYRTLGAVPGSGLFTYIWDMEAVGVYETLIEQGVPREIAGDAAEETGFLNAAVEVFGAALILRQSGVGDLADDALNLGLRQTIRNVTTRQALSRAGVRMAEAGFIGAAEEGIQETVAMSAEEGARRRAGVDYESPEGAIAERYLESIRAGMEGGLGLGAPVTSANLYLDMRAVRRAEQNQEAFANLAANAQSSRVRERLPTAAAAAVDASLEGTPRQTVRIDADAWTEHFQGARIDPFKAAEQVGVSREALQQALLANADIEISTGQYYAHLAASPHNNALLRHARWLPGDFTQAEIEAGVPERVQKEVAAAVEDTVQQTEAHSSLRAEAEAWSRARFAREESNAGPNELVARQYAKLEASLPATILARMQNAVARGEIPQAVADRYAAQLRTLFQSGLDFAGPAKNLDAQTGVAEMEQRSEYVSAKTQRDALQAEVDRTGAALRALSGGGAMGLTPDDVKASPEWQAAKRAYDAAFAALRQFNQRFTKDFAQDIRAERRARDAGGEMSQDAAPASPKPAAWIAERFSTEEINSWWALADDPNATPEQILTHPIQVALEAEAPPPTFTFETIAEPGALADRRYTMDGQTFDAPGYVAHMRAKFEAEAPAPLRQERVAVIVTGQPGAGKSTTRAGLAGMLGAVSVDVDELRVGIPEFAEGKGSSLSTQAEATELGRVLLDEFLNQGQNILVELVGKAEIDVANRANYLKAKGYSVSLANVNVSFDNSVRRYAKRTIAGGRWVHAAFIRAVADKPAQLFPALVAEGSLAGYIQVDANGPQGSETVTSAQGAIDGQALQAAFNARRNGPGRDASGIDGAGAVDGSPDGQSQGLNQNDARGSIRYNNFKSGEFGAALIRMGEASDLSTFLHEFGHLGHLVLESIATDPQAPQEFKDMWANTLSWWGVSQEQWSGFSVEQKREHFEGWARSFEAHLMEGKAPSLSLREAFAAFKAWLVQIYKQVLRLDAKLTPEIRDVFDRLIATDQEIAEARAHMGADFSFTREAFKTDEEFSRYQQAIAEAREAADGELRARVMDAHIRKDKRWWRSERRRVRTTAEIEVTSDPARRAYEWLAFGEWTALPVETNEEGVTLPIDAGLQMPEGLPEMKLSARALMEDYGEGVFDTLPVGLRPLRNGDVESVLENAMALKRQGRTRQPQRLWSFIKAQGGIKDEGGEIRQALGSGRARPGLINNVSGRSVDDLAMAAWEAGYFGAVPRKGGVAEMFQDGSGGGALSFEQKMTLRDERIAEAAAEGFVSPFGREMAFHASTSPWMRSGAAADLAAGEGFGLHIGNRGAAVQAAEGHTSVRSRQRPQIYLEHVGVRVDGREINMTDIENWGSAANWRVAVDDGLIQGLKADETAALRQLLSEMPEGQRAGPAINEMLRSFGVRRVRYSNRFERRGEPSVIVLDPADVRVIRTDGLSSVPDYTAPSSGAEQAPRAAAAPLMEIDPETGRAFYPLPSSRIPADRAAEEARRAQTGRLFDDLSREVQDYALTAIEREVMARQRLLANGGSLSEASRPLGELLDPEAIARAMRNARATADGAPAVIEGELAVPRLPDGGSGQGVTFRTSRGSTYEVHENGTTTRNKAARSDPGHEGQQGPQPRSERTIYVTEDVANALATPQGSWRVYIDGDTVSLLTPGQGGRWGISPSQRNLPFETVPREGLTPIEVWNADEGARGAFRKVHFGNPIAEVTSPRAPTASSDDVAAGFEMFQDDVSADRRPTPRELLDTLIDDIKNVRQVYSVRDEAAVAAYQNRADAIRWFESRDIDLDGTKDEIRAQIEAALTKEAAEQGEGWHPDDIAPWFGFESGDQMIQALRGLKPRAVAIDEIVERRLEDEYGDIFKDGTVAEAARFAAHVEAQSRKIELELEAIQRATGGKRAPVGNAARAYAERQITLMTVKQVRGYDSFLAGERRAARNALEAVEKGDMIEAGVWKQRQLISFHLYRLARNASDEMDRAQRYFQKFDRDGVRARIHPPLLEQIDQALEGVDLRKSPPLSATRRRTFLNWYQEMQAEGLEHMVAVDPDFLEQVKQRPFNTLTLEEARGMRDAVRNFEHIGRRWREVLAARDNRLLDEAVGEMTARMAEVKPLAFTNPETHSPGLVESLDTTRQRFHAQLSRVEFVARAMDGMKDNGPVWNGLFRPLTEARDREEMRMEEAKRDVENLFSVYDAKERADMWTKRRFYPQVPNRDGTRMGRSFTKQEVLAIALNTGNEYNFNALIAGDNWNEAQVRALLDAALDGRDWAFVQSAWDYVNSYWPDIARLYEQSTGVVPTKVEARPFQNRYGEWAGGYWHLDYDYGRDQRVREEMEHGIVQEAFGGFRLRTQTPNGFSKARQGSGGRPVRLDLSILTEHVNEVIHDIEFRIPVLNAWRLIKHQGFRDAFVRAAGQQQYDQLKPWLQYVATERMPPERGFSGIIKLLRRNTPIALMGYAVSTVAQQPAGLMGTFHRVGTHRVMGKVVSLLGQPWTWQEHARFINTRSTLMRNRTRISQREIRDMVQEINSQPHVDAVNLLASGTVSQKAEAASYLTKMMQRYALFPLAFVDKWVSSAAWKAAYDNALAGRVDGVNPQNEADVIAYADSVIRTTFGSGRPEDLSPVMRSTEIGKLITPAFSYFNTQFNQLYNEQAPGMMRGQISPIEFTTFIVFTLVVQALVSQWLAGRWEPDEDESEEARNVRLGVEVALTPVAGVPLVRDMTRATLQTATTGATFGSNVPALGALSSTGTGLGGVAHDLATDGEISRKSMRDVTMAAGYWFGLPSNAMWRAGEAATDIATGEDDLSDPVDTAAEAFLRDRR